jgi:4,5-dihydroxyphthalate decarboxylase
VDAWIGAGQSPAVAGVRRLFADAQAEERAYYASTGVFPIMHVLVVKRRVLEADPGLAARLFRIFDQAKRRAQRRLWSTSVAYVTLPWILAAAEEQTGFMGHGDPWPYGLAANQPTLDTLLRYMHEQGLLWSDLQLTDYFPALEPDAS